MTKTEMTRRARRVRAELARFNDLQTGHMRRFVTREWNVKPDYSAMNHLLFAQKELNDLVRQLREERYGS